MSHDRALVIGAVAFVPGRVRGDALALGAVRDELERALRNDGWPVVAPFRWVGLIIRYGSHWNLAPEFQRINKKHGDLPIAIEIPMAEVHRAPVVELERIFRYASVAALLAVAEKFKLPSEAIERHRSSECWFPRTAV